MLTDIFAYRYLNQPIWSDFSETEQRMLIQAFLIVSEAFPYYTSEGKEIETYKSTWKLLHDLLARELGVNELSKRYYCYSQKNAYGQEVHYSGNLSWYDVCKNFVTSKPSSSIPIDRYIKERISLIELALRFKGDEVAKANSALNKEIQAAELQEKRLHNLGVVRNSVAVVKSNNVSINAQYEQLVSELNERFRRSKAPLTYHNGFIQLSSDSQIEDVIRKPFWDLIADLQWENIDIDMKEAIDRRDSNGKDAALFAAKALESAIKIVSDKKGWTTGSEKGASNYIDNLASKRNGNYLEVWEGELLKEYFKKVRNSLGHGPGSEPMPNLTLEQTDWAIETSMSWIRSIIRRHKN